MSEQRSFSETLRDNQFIAAAAVVGISLVLWKALTSNTKKISNIPSSPLVYTVPNPNPGESAIYRSILVKDKPLVDNLKGYRTIEQLLIDSFRKYADQDFVGTRVVNSDGSRGPFVFKKYKQHEALVKQFAAALVKNGNKPYDRIGLYSINCEEWLVAEHACYMGSMTPVTLYDTLGPSAARFILNHAEISTVIVSAASYPKLVAALENNENSKDKSSVKRIVTIQPVKNVDSVKKLGIDVVSFEEFIATGKDYQPDLKKPNPDDLATIMYTSGTTGEPKGVMLTHRNIVSALGGFELNGDKASPNIYLSYLPLAHIMERIAVFNNINDGCVIGMYSGDIKMLLDDFQALKPTTVVGAPRVYQRIYDRVMNQVNESGPIKKALFNFAYGQKVKALNEGRETPFWDKLIFSKIHDKVFGGRVEFLVSGSAPLSTQVHEFLRVVFTKKVLEGYGMTETSAACSIQTAKWVRVGSVGAPLGCVEVKLVDVPDRKYFTTDKPCPRGELCLRGPAITQGYYKNKEKTDEAFKDGWLLTGDIARINEDGTISIIDRKKNIFKLSQGEYVAPEYLENIFCRATLVAQCFVYGSSAKSQLIAVVIPDEEVLTKWAKQNNIQGDFKALCRNEQVKKAILEDMTNVGKAAKLNGFEMVKAIHCDHELWTIDNCLTPTMKLKRADCQARYQTELDQLYAGLPE